MREGLARWGVLAGLLLGVVCYNLPWFTHPTAGFMMNAFDLAEWSSLHPAVRSSSPPLLTSFLLRWPLVALAAALALHANEWHDARLRWTIRALSVLFLLRLIPPADFLSSARSDPNYRQMALLAVLGGAGILAALVLSRRAPRIQVAWLLMLLLSAVAAGWWGLSRAGVLLDNFEIRVRIGSGIVGLSVLAGGVLLALGWQQIQGQRERIKKSGG